MDDTGEGYLTLYGSTATSASVWKPSQTVLLIANPGWRIDRTAKLSLNANSQLHIDPNMADARYVRALAQRLTKREHVNPPFPSDVFDVNEAENAAVKVLYKLGEIDEFVRSNPREKAVGFISVIITELHILTNFKRGMLMSGECCGVPIFASSVKADCKQCEQRSRCLPAQEYVSEDSLLTYTDTLRINPRIVRFSPFSPVVIVHADPSKHNTESRFPQRDSS